MSENISDTKLFETVHQVAGDDTSALGRRAAALATLVAWADSNLRLSIVPTPESKGLPVIVGYGSINHPWTRRGREPMTAQQRAAIRGFLVERGRIDPDSGLRYAARRAVEWIDRNAARHRQPAPAADHHQHLFSPTMAALLAPDSVEPKPLTARDVIALLDSAGIRKAVLLSAAYIYGSPSRSVEDEYAKVRAENDWNAAQAAEYPGRLIAFCGFNPLEDYALQELERCARHPGLRRGIKLHFGNADVQLENPSHVAQLRRVFRAANQHRMAIVVHTRASISRKRPYGARQATLFLEQLVPAAPDVPIQVAHLAGTGPGYEDPPADSAMAVLAEAMKQHDPRTRRLWFDVTTVVDTGITSATASRVVQRIRQVGVGRVLYGSDAALGSNLRPREAWAAFRRLPLTQEEFVTIARNEAPYFR